MMSKCIVLDAGHGKYGNPYPVIEGKYEGTQNFIYAGKLAARLEDAGFTVLLTRPTIDDDPSLAERGELAGKNNAVLFLSLHSNAPGTSTPPERYPLVRGVMTFYSLTAKEENAPFAAALNAAAAGIMQTDNRGIMIREYPSVPEDDYYGVIRAAAQSGCRQAFLIEHGFHTNIDDATFLTTDACLDRLADAEAAVICKYFGQRHGNCSPFTFSGQKISFCSCIFAGFMV